VSWAVIGAGAALAWGVYAATLPLVDRWLRSRREWVLHAITRE
jgi:hypothetical protein